MWQPGLTYTFTPSGDSDELHLKILAEVPVSEAVAWFETTYNHLMEMDATKGFKAIVVKGGWDADTRHRKGDTYYVLDTEFGLSHSDPLGPRIIK